MKTRRIPLPARAGFTFVEAMIAISLLAIMFLAVAQTSSRASDAFDEGSADHILSTSTHRTLERMAQAIEYSDATILAGLGYLGADQVTFRVPVDFVAGVVVSRSMQVLAEREPGELDDGQDNDGDGLVDELRVVEVVDLNTPDERRTVLLSGVSELFDGELANDADDNGNGLIDEAGLSFSSDGNVVTLRLSVQRRGEGGRVLSKTAETAVRLRN
ncbi:MAG TPA: prepilin-type N-terminal cleavage/methylation domain-containing protein [Planctomycetota bacterium]